MIEVVNLKKSYNGNQALDSINFSITSGTVTGFLGPNGAGKTTTMRILCGYIPPSSGGVVINNINAVEEPFEVKKVVGYLPEDNPLYYDLTPLEYLEFCANIRNMSSAYARKRIKEVIEICSLNSVLIKPIATLSKGFRQRVGIAQAILHDPPVLIMDEPTSGLDPNQILEIRNLINELKGKKSIILSTHIMQEAQALCGRIIIINKGRIVADGTHEEISSPSGIEIYKIQVDGPDNEVYEELRNINHIKNIRKDEIGFILECNVGNDPRREIFKLTVRKDWTILSLEKTRQSLEDVFKKLTVGG